MFEEKVCVNSSSCSGEDETLKIEKKVLSRAERQVEIEFLFLDTEVCDRCSGTEANLETALNEIAELLKTVNIDVEIKKIHVQSLEQAKELGFVSSPTIRVNGSDLQLETKENYCPKCSDLSGTETNCRIWTYQGKEYKTAPKELITEAVLREIYGKNDAPTAAPAQTKESLLNLENFFAARDKQNQTKQ